jgi:drug/metabolite transporter (DMT)-like permease
MTSSSRAGLAPVLAATGLVLALASSFPAIALALRDFDPLPLAAVRLTLAATVAVVLLSRQSWPRPGRRELAIIALGGLLTGSGFVLGNAGQLTVSIGAASVLLGTQPLYMVLIAVLLFREPFARRNWIGLALAVAGLVMVATGQPGGLQFGAGTTLLIGAAVGNAVLALLQRPLLARYDPLRLSGMLFVAGAIWLSPWLGQGLGQAAAAAPGSLAALVYLALIPTFVGQLCLAYTIRSLGAARAGTLFYLIPVVALIVAWIGLGQRPEVGTVLGGAIALAGVLLATRRAPAPVAPSPTEASGPAR